MRQINPQFKNDNGEKCYLQKRCSNKTKKISRYFKNKAPQLFIQNNGITLKEDNCVEN